MYFSGKCNVSRILALNCSHSKIRDEMFMHICLLPLEGHVRTLCNPRLQCVDTMSFSKNIKAIEILR